MFVRNTLRADTTGPLHAMPIYIKIDTRAYVSIVLHAHEYNDNTQKFPLYISLVVNIGLRRGCYAMLSVDKDFCGPNNSPLDLFSFSLRLR